MMVALTVTMFACYMILSNRGEVWRTDDDDDADNSGDADDEDDYGDADAADGDNDGDADADANGGDKDDDDGNCIRSIGPVASWRKVLTAETVTLKVFSHSSSFK